jgi:hypothetical protein
MYAIVVCMLLPSDCMRHRSSGVIYYLVILRIVCSYKWHESHRLIVVRLRFTLRRPGRSLPAEVCDSLRWLRWASNAGTESNLCTGACRGFRIKHPRLPHAGGRRHLCSAA